MRVGDGEQALLEAARRGDSVAYRRLVEPHTRGLYRVSIRILGDRSLAEDAVQEALWSAYQRLDRFEERASFSSWLYRIGVNAALSLRRKHMGRVQEERPHLEAGVEMLGDVPDDAPQPVDIVRAHQFEGALADALTRLTPLERAAFVLRHLEQRSLDEIAGVLESNVNACKQAIFRAVRKLRPALSSWRTET